jgi:hypothetical protein
MKGGHPLAAGPGLPTRIDDGGSVRADLHIGESVDAGHVLVVDCVEQGLLHATFVPWRMVVVVVRAPGQHQLLVLASELPQLAPNRIGVIRTGRVE